jgi:hypothetical protein
MLSILLVDARRSLLIFISTRYHLLPSPYSVRLRDLVRFPASLNILVGITIHMSAPFQLRSERVPIIGPGIVLARGP